MKIALAPLVLLLPLAVSCANAGARPETVPVPEPVRSSVQLRKQYVLMPGDQIEVSVRGVPEVSRSVAIRPDGYITLPVLDDVEASGLAPLELDAKLTDLFSERLRNPEVTVIAINVRPPVVFVIGEVNVAGPVSLRDAPTAVQAITQAGGFRRSAATSDVSIIRLSDDGYLEAIPIPVEILGQTGTYMALRMAALQADDVIFVPESGRSQYQRFMDDFLIRPLSAFNLAFGAWLNFRLVETFIQ